MLWLNERRKGLGTREGSSAGTVGYGDWGVGRGEGDSLRRAIRIACGSLPYASGQQHTRQEEAIPEDAGANSAPRVPLCTPASDKPGRLGAARRDLAGAGRVLRWQCRQGIEALG